MDTKEKSTYEKNQTLLMVLMSLCLVSFFFLAVTNKDAEFGSTSSIHPLIWIIRLVTAIVVLAIKRQNKDFGILVLGLYFLLFVFRIVIVEPANLFKEDISESIFAGTWLFFACYNFGWVLSNQQIYKFIRLSVSFWTIVMDIACIVSLYATTLDQYMFNLTHGSVIGIYAGRLMLFNLPTTTGLILSLSALLALCGLYCTNRLCLRFFYAISTMLLMLCLSLTGSRTGYISFASGTGALAFILMYYRIEKKNNRIKNWKKLSIAIVSLILVTVIVLYTITKTSDLYNRIREGRGLFISNAYAETLVSDRGFIGNDDVFNGRIEIWKAVLEVFRQKPVLLLTGASKMLPMTDVCQITGTAYAHCHNILLQILLESGIPGVLLLLAFWGYTAKRAFALIRMSNIPIWQKLLPVLVASIIVGDMAECSTWLKATQCPMNAILFLTSGIICSLGKLKTESDFICI